MQTHDEDSTILSLNNEIFLQPIDQYYTKKEINSSINQASEENNNNDNENDNDSNSINELEFSIQLKQDFYSENEYEITDEDLNTEISYLDGCESSSLESTKKNSVNSLPSIENGSLTIKTNFSQNLCIKEFFVDSLTVNCKEQIEVFRNYMRYLYCTRVQQINNMMFFKQQCYLKQVYDRHNEQIEQIEQNVQIEQNESLKINQN
jgi:hypothetical protein